MVADDKVIEIVNKRMRGNKDCIPRFLYKYRPFDKFAYEMLADNYLYLCPAENLDDPSECRTTLTVEDFYNVATNRLKVKCVDAILEFIKPYAAAADFQLAKSKVYSILTPNGEVRKHFLLDIESELQMLAPEADTALLINLLACIPDALKDPNIASKFGDYIGLAIDARQYMGICSLSELADSTQMWEKYADDASGYCVKYDMTDYQEVDLLYPVVYQDERNINIINNIVLSYVGEMILKLSCGKVDADCSSYARMFLTKNTAWAYQKEWRLLGDANQKIQAPKISAVCLGRNVSQEHKQEMIRFCNEHNIVIKENKF